MKKASLRKAQVVDAKKLGEALKDKRKVDGLSTRDVADILNIPNSTISRMERFLPAEVKSILVVCDWLGRSVCDFIIYKKVPAFPVIMD